MRLRLYTVHVPPGRSPDEAELVTEGFCWPALFLGPIWAAWHGLWIVTIVVLAATVGLSLLGELWPSSGAIASVAGLAFGVLFAAEANDLRRRDLTRRGWRMAGVAGGAGVDAAHRRYLDLAALRAG